MKILLIYYYNGDGIFIMTTNRQRNLIFHIKTNKNIYTHKQIP